MRERKVIIDDKIPFIRGVLDSFSDVRYISGEKISHTDVCDADCLIVRTRTKCDEALLEGSRVGLVATATIGFDHIDIDYCNASGVDVVTSAGCNAVGVAHYIMSALVSLERKFPNISDMRLGIVGVGNVGSQVKKIAEKVGFKTVCCDPFNPGLNYISLEKLLSVSDIVTFHVPLSHTGAYKTNRMVDDLFFEGFKRGGIFINSSRGEIVDEGALVRAVESGIVSATVIDVWNNEPQISLETLGCTTLATPHIAGYSLQGKANGTAFVVRACADFMGIDQLADWYPPQVDMSVKRVVSSWEELKVAMGECYDINIDDRNLKKNPEAFECLRNNYNYRDEFF